MGIVYTNLKPHSEYQYADEKGTTYNSHLIINSRNGSILDPESKQSHEEIKAVKCQRREYPRRCVNGVIAKSDEECNHCEYATS